MPAAVTRPQSPAPAAPSAGRPWLPPFAAESGDAWPRTNRWIPWLLAAFLVMLWLVPFDSTEARVSLPLDPKLDRFLLTAMMIVWLASLFAGGRPAPRFRRSLLETAVLVFAGVAVLSVVLNIATIASLDQTEIATKKIALLLSYVVFFFIVATTLRQKEVERFTKLFLALAGIAAVGVLYQYFTERNLFFEWWSAIVPDQLFSIREVGGQNRFVRPPVTGATRHALALAAMFAMALALAVVYLARARTAKWQVIYALAVVLMVGGVFATSRKTGSFAGLSALTMLLALRPREIGRLVPIGVVVFAALLFAAPAAVEKQLEQVKPSTISAGASGQSRSSDYDAITPDFREHLLIGRGYGTYEPSRFRVLDNNWLLLLMETGLLGVAAFAFVLVAALAGARSALRRSEPARAGPALAVAGATAAFAMAMLLFDVLSFAQAPYMFFFLAGIAVVAGVPARPRPEPLPPLADRVDGAESLPPLAERRGADPLPELRERLEMERAARRARREAEEHGGRPRRRADRPGRPAPVRRHVGAPLPGAPTGDDEPTLPARGRLARAIHARAAGARSGVRRVGRRGRSAAVALLALGMAVVAFGDRPAPEGEGLPELGEAGGGDDPLGLAEFAAPPSGAPTREERPRRAERAGRGGRPATAAAPAVADTEPARARPAPTRPVADEQPGGREREGERPRPRRRRPPDRPRSSPVAPDPELDRRGGDQSPQRPERKDCLPGDETEPLLTGIGIDPCVLSASTGMRVRAAYEAGRLTRAELDYLVEMLRRARAAEARRARAAEAARSAAAGPGSRGIDTSAL